MTRYELMCKTRPSSVGSVHEFIDLHLAGSGPVGRWLPEIHVIVDELASNIEKYAYGEGTGPYLIRVDLENRRLQIDFEDNGLAFDPTQVEEDPIAGEQDAHLGRLGLLLVRRLANEMAYSRIDDRNVTSVILIIWDK